MESRKSEKIGAIKQKIRDLLVSGKSTPQIIKTLSEWRKKHPESFNDTSIRGRTLFHILVKQQNHNLLAELLNDPTWRDLAQTNDHYGDSVLHYAATGEETTKQTLNIIIKQLPDLLNRQNSKGNTPLHSAVELNIEWSVTILVNDHKADRAIKNSNGKTAVDLAGTNSDLRKRLLWMDLTAIKSIDIRHRPGSLDSMDSLNRLSPLLSSSRSSSSSPSTIQMDIHPASTSRSEENQNSIHVLLKDFAITLTLNSLTIITDKISASPIESLKLIWLLVSCQTEEGSKREFAFDVIKSRAIGLLSTMPLSKILTHLRSLYSYFDTHQKLVANFIVSQLIYHDAIDSGTKDTLVPMQLKFFLLANVNKSYGLNELGENINTTLEILSKKCLATYGQEQANEQPFATEKSLSFDNLINSALAKSRAERVQKEIPIIAKELKMLSLEFYQKVSITEFNNCNWIKDQNATLSPCMTDFTSSFEKLSNHLIYTILKQKTATLKNALEFIIDLANELYPIHTDQYFDLHHTMMLSTVLNNSNISRLSIALLSLSENDKTKLAEISRATSPEHNFKAMREINGMLKLTLPFLGIFQADVYHVLDADIPAIDKFGMIGNIFHNFHRIKLSAKMAMVSFQSDLQLFLASYEACNESKLDALSLSHQLPDASVTSPRALPTRTTSKRQLNSVARLIKSKAVTFFEHPTVITSDIKSKKESDSENHTEDATESETKSGSTPTL